MGSTTDGKSDSDAHHPNREAKIMSIPLRTRVVLVNAMNHTGETGTVVWTEGRKHNGSIRYTVSTDAGNVFASESQLQVIS